MNPAMTFSSVVLPAPDGPRIAVNWPDRNVPLRLRKMILLPPLDKKITL